MDKISGFSDDELLVKILTFLPTKVAVSTSILSKQWRFLWMRLPKLKYDDTKIYFLLQDEIENRTEEFESRTASLLSESERIRCFIDRNLPLHRAPITESLRLKFCTAPFRPDDITSWVAHAVSRSVRELSVDFFRFTKEPNASLPSSLYTCKSLVTLHLLGRILVDVPHVVRFPSLKNLHLQTLTYANEESLQRLLSSSSVLEDLTMERSYDDNLRKFAIIIPSLLSLTFAVGFLCTSDWNVIDTPSLKCFKAIDHSKKPCFIVNMPKLEKADLTVFGYGNLKNYLEPVKSVKRLSLLFSDDRREGPQAIYGDAIDFAFNELEHLNFSAYSPYWSKLLFCFLKGSSKLRNLKYHEGFTPSARDAMYPLICWKHLTSVPQCLLTSLQTFQLKSPRAGVEILDLAKYILRNSLRLKTARILIESKYPNQKLEILKELEFCSRGSATCNLVFE